ncbi:hypothetical protein PULV_a0369 [Pseudoalteromonas ulvae UL12]|nr:hypothetical protein [Pseudoalteromonas ulvae UL12]
MASAQDDVELVVQCLAMDNILNHDACADVEGQQMGVCSNEWTAAADDFWFSPDCTTPPSS